MTAINSIHFINQTATTRPQPLNHNHRRHHHHHRFGNGLAFHTFFVKLGIVFVSGDFLLIFCLYAAKTKAEMRPGARPWRRKEEDEWPKEEQPLKTGGGGGLEEGGGQ